MFSCDRPNAESDDPREFQGQEILGGESAPAESIAPALQARDESTYDATQAKFPGDRSRLDVLFAEALQGLPDVAVLISQTESLMARSRLLREHSAYLRRQCEEQCRRMAAERERARIHCARNS